METKFNDMLSEPEKESGVCREELLAMQKCRRGSKKAFEFLVNKYMKDAYFIALGFVGNREDAQDLSQEAFVRAFRHIKKVRPEKGFFPWFYQILKNLCISHLRKMKYRKASSLDVEGCPEVAAQSECFNPEQVVGKDEMKKKVWQAISKLDEKHREVIILRHFQNKSYEQIAAALFCNKGTVTSRLYYARKKLEELLSTSLGNPAVSRSPLRLASEDAGAGEIYEDEKISRDETEKGGMPDDMP